MRFVNTLVTFVVLSAALAVALPAPTVSLMSQSVSIYKKGWRNYYFPFPASTEREK